jgi:hypothetical protein
LPSRSLIESLERLGLEKMTGGIGLRFLTLEPPESIEVSIFTGLSFVDPARISKNCGVFLKCSVERNKGVEVVELGR